MRDVKIKKDQLLDIIKKNREEHRDIFLEAQKKYREEVIVHLDGMLAEAREGKNIRRHVELIEPQDHTDDYDRVVRMLELSIEDVVTLTEMEFQWYVLDEWGWSQQWAISNSGYSDHPKLARLAAKL